VISHTRRDFLNAAGNIRTASNSQNSIGLVFAYTAKTAAVVALNEIERRIQRHVDYTNLSYQLHNLPQRVHIAHIYQTNYTEPDITHFEITIDADGNRLITNNSDSGETCPQEPGHPGDALSHYYNTMWGTKEEGQDKRSKYGGDVFVLIADHNAYSREFCGLAYNAKISAHAYIAMSILDGCAPYRGTLAHELGHTHGATHCQHFALDTNPRKYDDNYIIPYHRTIMGLGRQLPLQRRLQRRILPNQLTFTQFGSPLCKNKQIRNLIETTEAL